MTKVAITLLTIISFIATGCGGSRTCTDAGQLTCRIDNNDVRALANPGRAGDFNILILSGGGADGAWGAGVLNGWGKATNGANRPDFDVVTSISTGTLLSTFAFLGTPVDYDAIRDSYTSIEEKDVYTARWLIALPFANSLNDTAPLRKLVDERFSKDVIDRVAQKGAATGQRLYVGTTDLDSGRLVIWDMCCIAREGNYKKYRDIVMASAAIPGLFPPVEIDGQMHVDGGVRSQMFLEKQLLPIVDVLGNKNAQAPAQPAPKPRFNVYTIVNGGVILLPDCVSANLRAIPARAASGLINASAIGDVYTIKYKLLHVRHNFELSYIPSDTLRNLPKPSGFNKSYMKALYDKGEEWGKNNDWYDSIRDVDTRAN